MWSATSSPASWKARIGSRSSLTTPDRFPYQITIRPIGLSRWDGFYDLFLRLIAPYTQSPLEYTGLSAVGNAKTWHSRTGQHRCFASRSPECRGSPILPTPLLPPYQLLLAVYVGIICKNAALTIHREGCRSILDFGLAVLSRFTELRTRRPCPYPPCRNHRRREHRSRLPPPRPERG